MCTQYYNMLSLICVLNIYYAFPIMCTQYYNMLSVLCVLNIYYAFVIMCTQYILCFPYYVYSIL